MYKRQVIDRVEKIPELFLVAVDRKNGKLAGYLTGFTTSEEAFQDKFFTNADLCDPDGKNNMLLGLEVLPKYRGQGLARELTVSYTHLDVYKRQGYMNNTYRIPSKEFKDFQAFQRREVAKLAKEMVDIVHEYGKEAMMFMGDHWIGMEPFMDEFASIGLDAVVGSVGNGATLRLFSDIKHVKYTEGRFLPYFFPDTFHEGGDPVKEAKVNWVTARRRCV